MWFGDDELMLDRDYRNVEADHGAGLTGEISARRYNMLASDLTVIGGDTPFAAGAAVDGSDGDAAVDLGAALTCACSQRLG